MIFFYSTFGKNKVGLIKKQLNMRFSTLVLLVIMIGFASLISAQSPRTFYVGHSLSDQIPDMVQSLSKDHPTLDFSWVYQSIPGAPLRYQWERKIEQEYPTIDPNYYGFYDETYGLASGEFDVLVLTESVPRYLSNIQYTYEYADSFYHYASAFNPDIKVYLYEDWHCLLSGTPTDCDYDIDANPWRERLTDDLAMWESVVDTLNARYKPTNPVCLIPAGQGLAALYDSIQVGAIPGITEIEDLFSDNIHLNDVGKYYVACIHFAMIHKTSPIGLTNQLQVWWGGDFEAPSSELAMKFQEMAWETVVNYPNSCLDVVSTKDTEQQNNISLSPNPTMDVFTVKGIIGNNTIVIIDSNGRNYKSITNSSEQTVINVEDFPAGLYFVKILDSRNNLITIEKLIKQN